MRKLIEMRKDLDQCDQQILELLTKRFSCIGEMIDYKKACGLPILEPDQEADREKTLSQAIGKLSYKEELLRIFRQIEENSKCVQSRNLFHYNIALIGFMGAGKSTVSQYLKDMLGMNEVDVDTRIVQDQKMPIKEIFARYGEEYFRNCESSAIVNLKDCRQTIISCGGGAVIREENVVNLKKNSRIVLLTASPETILERVKDSDERPILNGNMNVEYIKELMEKRASIYRKAADIIIETDGKDISGICEELIQALIKLEA
ncbi:shikimate kinase [Clostridium boliviensis]|uniref:Shikimate kinase n=1 Tax=Clostridium boliviensis TaxID=318465 RepID=A0ABU4GLT0_9CLOT|nr:shikimate kinase [Clostridium boliviensis]MDW2797955.1 shikimate kinase [Clostridium boliviensis]